MEQRRKPPRQDLILKFITATATPEESALLEEWYNSIDHSLVEWPSDNPDEEERVRGRLWQLIRQELEDLRTNEILRNPEVPVRRLSNGLHRWIIAASITVLVAGGGIYIYSKTALFHGKLGIPPNTTLAKQDIAPGGNKAVLTLANGRTVVLDNAQNGNLADQGGAQIVKLDSGEIAYRHTGTGVGETLYNTISTPRGGQYTVILPDGSKVWLNAATSLRYPTVFSGSARSVELMGGEAYFEIARRALQPFIVHIHPGRQGDQELAVNVLGTSFDINAYADEPLLRATLVDGSIKIDRGTESALLHPGEQAQISILDTTILNSVAPIHILQNADIKAVTAWKNGFFRFNSDDIEAIMRQIARWYDVDVAYQVKGTAIKLTGVVGRDTNLSDVLNAMEEGGVHFKIEGRKIIVLP